VIVLDTHAAVWMAMDDPELGARSRALLARGAAAGALAVSAVSLWELGMLIAKGRLKVSVSAWDLRSLLLRSGVREVPLDGEIALRSAELDLHGDPADRFIAATAIANEAALMTADRQLLRWQNPIKRHDART
jgi:PIN domain nuclease of toxin-antitoxin system